MMRNDATAMQRVLVMGPPGSGKSTLARRLAERIGVPAFHLDQFYWRAGWIEAPAEAFRADVERVAALPAWVIDGNYTDTIESRLRAADTVIYMDVSNWVSLLRILRRNAAHYGRVRIDAAPGCAEKFDLPFLRYAWHWNRERRAPTLALLERHAGRTIILRSRADRRRLLAEVEGDGGA